ncbi:MAG: MBL fold metallo-hydrolase [Acidobacteriota bacterium]|nr:MBL fold metallo-hydrolase [Acidobacteriota bacterium]
MMPKAILLLTAVSAMVAADLPPLVHLAAPGVFYRQSEDEKRIIATTSWVEFRDFLVVIDANYPWGARAIIPDIRKTTAKPIRFVLDTHYHADHSYGNGEFAALGATIISSDATAADSIERNTKGWAQNTDTGVFDLKQYSQVHPQLTFHDRIAIDNGVRRLEFIRLGPAHTRGDAIAWLPTERIVFTGDLCTTRAQNNLSDPGFDPYGWLRALSTMEDLNPAIVIPGHGIQGTIESLRGQRAYLAAIIEAVKDGIAKGDSVEQLQKSINLDAHKPWSANEKRNSAAIAAIYQKLKERHSQ